MVERSIKELKVIARGLKIKGYYSMTKSKLVHAIIETKEKKKKEIVEEIFQNTSPETLLRGDLVRVRGVSEDIEIGEIVRKYSKRAIIHIKTGVKRDSRVGVDLSDIGKVIEKEIEKENILEDIKCKRMVPYLDPLLNVRLSERETLFLTRISSFVKGYYLGMGVYKVSGKSVNYYTKMI